VIFAKWREETAAELTTLYEGGDIGREFTAVTGTGEHSSPRFTFPHRKRALETGLFWLDRLIGRLELAVWEGLGSPVAATTQHAQVAVEPSQERFSATPGREVRTGPSVWGTNVMPDQQALDDRQHAIEFQKMLAEWRPLRVASKTSLHILARFEPADSQTHQARAILDALRTHGRPTARFVASQGGSSGSGAILWWVEGQLADDFTRDNESATKYDDIRQIVENALLQVEAATASERHFMELAIAEARKSKAEERGLHPKVGAVVVKDGKAIATAHRGELALGDHAEFTVLEKKLKDETLAGATVYATLEPCTRRSPEKTPCAQRLIDRRVKKVVIGVLDPNPVICGKGQRLLQKNGIEIKHFDHDLAMQLEELNRDWTKVQEAAANAQPPLPTPPALDPNAELRELQRRFVAAQDRFPRDVSFALAMIPHEERQAWREARRWFDDMYRAAPPQEFGWKCIASAGDGDRPETVSIPAAERTDGRNDCPLLSSVEPWRCWLMRQSTTVPFPAEAKNLFESLAVEACRLLDLRDCGMIMDGRRFEGKRGEYQHLLRWAVEKLSSDECQKMTWLDPPHDRVRTTWGLPNTPKRWFVEMPCVFAAVARALDRHIAGQGRPWPPT
jgi:pyrimidine deaminase RibD-like protein